MKKDNLRRAFVEVTTPVEEEWKTNIYYGPRDGSGTHAHIALSGASILYFRDINGSEIINHSNN